MCKTDTFDEPIEHSTLESRTHQVIICEMKKPEPYKIICAYKRKYLSEQICERRTEKYLNCSCQIFIYYLFGKSKVIISYPITLGRLVEIHTSHTQISLAIANVIYINVNIILRQARMLGVGQNMEPWACICVILYFQSNLSSLKM